MNEMPLRLSEILPAPVAGRCALCGDEYPAGTPITACSVAPGLMGWVTAEPCINEDVEP